MRSADLIREARLRAGLSQTDLAERFGCSQQQLSRWEAGRVQPSFETLQRVLAACQLELSVALVTADSSYGSLLEQSLKRTPPERVSHLLERLAFKERMRAAQEAQAVV